MQRMVLKTLRVGNKIIKPLLHGILNIVKTIIHCLFESFSLILKAKRKFVIRKRTPWKNECSLMLVKREYFDLIVAREAIHKWENFSLGVIINNLVDERGWVFVLVKISINISIIDTYSDHILLIYHRNNVRDPIG